MFQLSEQEQELLLQHARDAVWAYLSGEDRVLPDMAIGPLTESHGIFVSIHKGSDLRGCIGNVHLAGPLYRMAAKCAISAAVGDPRSMPLTSRDFPGVTFEISVLSAMERVEKIEDIEVGTHGLMISKRDARGLLLPQVASSCGWTRERFLAETSRKADLGPDEWRDGATIYRFRALVFAEKRLQAVISS